MSTKIINLGLPRTGTQSLWRALQMLGITSRHYSSKVSDMQDYSSVCEVSLDIPIEDIREAYPDLRWMMTVRNIPDWITSVQKTRAKASPNWNPFWRRAVSASQMELMYARRMQEAAEALGGSDQLFYFDVCGGDGWEPLCAWAGKPVPDKPFPYKDRTK